MVSVNKWEDFSPAGFFVQGLLHTQSTLLLLETLKIITDGELCVLRMTRVFPSIRAEPVKVI